MYPYQSQTSYQATFTVSLSLCHVVNILFVVVVILVDME